MLDFRFLDGLNRIRGAWDANVADRYEASRELIYKAGKSRETIIGAIERPFYHSN